jgi:hypothetical protein
MFAPQPVHKPAVFFLRAITHDWSDDYCVKILRQLRAVAAPNTQLIVIDNAIAYACGESDQSHDILGKVVRPTAPSPLLPNWGAANSTTYLGDIHVSILPILLWFVIDLSFLADVEFSQWERANRTPVCQAVQRERVEARKGSCGRFQFP